MGRKNKPVEDGEMRAIAYPTEDHRALAAALKIEEGELVLDVGGGHNAVAFADLVVDIDFGAGHHRDGHQILLDFSKHKYVRADLCRLPFGDKTFDRVICIQVLEHVEDPAAACQELMRVSHGGFLEVPRKWTEYYAGHPTHKWLIDEVDNVLIFAPVSDGEYPFLNFALPPLWNSSYLQKALEDYRNIPCIQIEWNGRFEYRVMKTSASHVNQKEILAHKHYCFARNLLYWMTPPEHGLPHAARALELMPKRGEYQFLYAFYLAVSGVWKKAAANGLSWRYCLFAVILRYFILSSHIAVQFFRRRLKIFFDRPENSSGV